jgi:hypothetical protein
MRVTPEQEALIRHAADLEGTTLQGLDDPFDPSDPTVAVPRAFASAAHYDTQVLQWFHELVTCYSLPEEVIAREGVLERVLEVAMDNPPYSSPGPDRVQLEEILV